MQRNALEDLKNWLIQPNRKPLVIRGARQVGKTWAARQLASMSGRRLIEINFEKQPTLAALFDSNEPRKILMLLGAALNQPIDPAGCLLLLDEIQAAAALFPKLRWFAEELPELPVIATGSLLDFVLGQHTFSMPVGRISFMHLEPLTFEEFLLAHGNTQLLDYLNNWYFDQTIPQPIHSRLTEWIREYTLIGGMPAAVASWIAERSPTAINQIQLDLLAAYRDDFNKYRGHIAIEHLDEVMRAVPQMLGRKFVYSRVNSSVPSQTVKNALDLLIKARIIHRVRSSAANGIPLGAEIRHKYFKTFFLDSGLCCASLGLGLTQLNAAKELIMVNAGGIAEQLVGQMLCTLRPFYVEPETYYWHRDEPGANAEIDYAIQHNAQIIPVEVKAGSTGGLKSLHVFMELKKLPLAIRINSELPTQTAIKVKSRTGHLVEYTLYSLPFYLAGQIPRLV